jgi:hypothetical protein
VGRAGEQKITLWEICEAERTCTPEYKHYTYAWPSCPVKASSCHSSHGSAPPHVKLAREVLFSMETSACCVVFSKKKNGRAGVTSAACLRVCKQGPHRPFMYCRTLSLSLKRSSISLPSVFLRHARGCAITARNVHSCTVGCCAFVTEKLLPLVFQMPWVFQTHGIPNYIRGVSYE